MPKRSAKPSVPQRHELTTEERRRGADAANQVRRAKRQAAEQLAEERLIGSLDKALTKLDALIDDEDSRVALQAARDVIDRMLGRPTQTVKHTGAEETGPVEIKLLFDHQHADG